MDMDMRSSNAMDHAEHLQRPRPDPRAQLIAIGRHRMEDFFFLLDQAEARDLRRLATQRSLSWPLKSGTASPASSPSDSSSPTYDSNASSYPGTAKPKTLHVVDASRRENVQTRPKKKPKKRRRRSAEGLQLTDSSDPEVERTVNECTRRLVMHRMANRYCD